MIQLCEISFRTFYPDVDIFNYLSILIYYLSN